MFIGMVGSRNLPEPYLRFCETLGEEAARRGHTVVSGNAKGADQAYARGANRICKASVCLKLPWENFEKEAIKYENTVHFQYTDDVILLAAKQHSTWSFLSNGVKKLFIRNAAIAKSSDALIAVREKDSPYGVTQHAISVAKTLQIPVFEITEPSLPRVDLPSRANYILDLLELATNKKQDIDTLLASLAVTDGLTIGPDKLLYDKYGNFVDAILATTNSSEVKC